MRFEMVGTMGSVHGQLNISYGLADRATSFETVPVDDMLTAMQSDDG